MTPLAVLPYVPALLPPVPVLTAGRFQATCWPGFLETLLALQLGQKKKAAPSPGAALYVYPKISIFISKTFLPHSIFLIATDNLVLHS